MVMLQGMRGMRLNETTKTKKETQERKLLQYEGLEWKERVPLFDNPPCPTCCTDSDSGKIKGSVKMSRDAEDMLIRAKRKPLTLTELYKELGLSGYKGLKCKQELIRSGSAHEVQLPTNRRGRRKTLLQVTPRGTEYLKSLGVVEVTKGRGGVRHLYYQRELLGWYKSRGYTTEIEATIGGTCLDLLVILKDGSRLGIELALSEQYEDVHALKALGAGIERLLFVCESKTVMEKVQRKVEAAMQNQNGLKPGFKLISDYLTDG